MLHLTPNNKMWQWLNGGDELYLGWKEMTAYNLIHTAQLLSSPAWISPGILCKYQIWNNVTFTFNSSWSVDMLNNRLKQKKENSHE